jgi:hypothetical protein
MAAVSSYLVRGDQFLRLRVNYVGVDQGRYELRASEYNLIRTMSVDMRFIKYKKMRMGAAHLFKLLTGSVKFLVATNNRLIDSTP